MESDVVRKVRRLNQELLEAKIEVEKLGIRRVEEAQTETTLDRERAKVDREVGLCQERAAQLRREIAANQAEVGELEEAIEKQRGENEAMVTPVLTQLREDIARMDVRGAPGPPRGRALTHACNRTS